MSILVHQVTPTCFPLNCVECFGSVKTERSHQKHWGTLFKCLKTGVVRLDLLVDADAYLKNEFQRRRTRGLCQHGAHSARTDFSPTDHVPFRPPLPQQLHSLVVWRRGKCIQQRRPSAPVWWPNLFQKKSDQAEMTLHWLNDAVVGVMDSMLLRAMFEVAFRTCCQDPY